MKKVATGCSMQQQSSHPISGCLALGHSNTFIVWTLGGSCTDQVTETIDSECTVRHNVLLSYSESLEELKLLIETELSPSDTNH